MGGARGAVMAGSTILDLSPPVLDRAAQPFATTLGTLDALHTVLTAFQFDGLQRRRYPERSDAYPLRR
jgi:hypothetical protein